TGSLRARHILDHWAVSRARFVKVFPVEYRRALAEMATRPVAAALGVDGAPQARKEAEQTIARARGGDKKSRTVPAK
ncbi:MAG TPA: hypothetical protein VFL86_17235, partial [Burkholderiaceae bacterium]|nr:hypothetical protein [Burkholderiaceae bacterium]